MQPDPILGAPTPADAIRLLHGVAVLDDDKLVASTSGVIIPATWLDPTTVADGDPILIAMSAGPTGPSQATVLGRLTTRPRPTLGKVVSVPVGSQTITVSTVEGNVVATFVASYSPVVGDQVRLTWNAGNASVSGKVGSTADPTPPPPSPTAPPGPAGSGTATFPAIDSGTYQIGSGWNDDYGFGQNLTQGTWSGRSYTGSWFYGTGPGSLAGRTIPGARMYLGPRRRIGSHNAPVVINLYAHTSPTRPVGDPARTVGPHPVSIPAGFGGDWIAIPPALAVAVIAAGGLGIAGGSYAGLVGRGENPQSGTVAIDWLA